MLRAIRKIIITSFISVFMPCFLHAYEGRYKDHLVQEIINIKDKYNISIIAPASVTGSPEGLAKTSEVIGAKYPKDMLNYSVPLSLANTAEYRLNHFIQEINKSEKQVIWALRGGSGSAHIIDQLFELPKPKTEHFFIGYSDITALHLFLSQEWGWKTIHGGLIDELYIEKEKNPDNYKYINDIIVNDLNEIVFNDLRPLNESAKNNKGIYGKLTGGNISLLQNSLGTSWEIKPEGKVLFFEAVHLVPYLYDRILFHLYQAKKFSNVKAIVVGNVRVHDMFSTSQEDLNNVTNYYANLMEKEGIPVYKTCMFGHSYHNYPLVYNSDVSIYSDGEKTFMKQSF